MDKTTYTKMIWHNWTLDTMTICGSQTLVKLKFLCFMTFKGAYNDHKCCNVIALCCETQPVFT